MSDTRNLKYTLHTYGTDNELQRLGVWRWIRPSAEQHSVPGDPDAPKTKYWLVYIHGGIWRDPRTTHLQAKSAITFLGAESNRARIAGFASLDYRLSPHPEFPQDAATTPPAKLRVAKHPDHLADVRCALAFLRREYGVGHGEGETPYVLYGHSCGATLAWQVVMGVECGGPVGRDAVPMPAAVVGFQGMYDLVGLNRRFKGAYRDMIAGAFGDDEEVWKEVSPVHFKGKFSETWTGCEKGVAVLAYSPQDEWIDMPEIDGMEARLKEEANAGIHVQTRRDLTGGHDEVAESGRTVATVLVQSIAGLDNVARIWKMTEELMNERVSN
ncbi:alpha/beta-hydrolase [Coniochaeta ligniaria NRRL 30616]|uniref:Kynurenine formamidase n=1 Tax=Coniochaeta ligniaria NRRL 30616 TaxID=1408157 RepID=A0A1J7JPN9_9PEZI|nr:alpha/beta-hydrolase [Coniochaeta ligniaria NRRL 30616]